MNYGANNGIQWVILTNGILWQVYNIRFEKPISSDLVCEFDFSQIDGKSEEHLEKLYIICKEGIDKDKDAREDYQTKKQCLNRFILGALICSEDGEVLTVIRRELRKLTDSVLLAPEDIKIVLENEVLKRDVIEGDEAHKAQNRVKRYYGKAAKETLEESKPETVRAPAEVSKTEISVSDQPLQAAQHQVKTEETI